MKSLFNNDFQYAMTRLQGSWLLFDKGNGEKELLRVNDGQPDPSDPTGNSFALANFGVQNVEGVKGKRKGSQMLYIVNPLGYVGDEFFARLPVRRSWKQGLRHDQVFGSKSPGSPLGSNRFEGLVKGFEKAMLANYVKYGKAVEEVEETGMPVPFDRKLCILPDFSVGYKGYKVGHLTGKAAVKLLPAFTFLQQEVALSAGEEHVV